MAFSKLKTGLRKAAERTVEGLWSAIGCLVDTVTPNEAANFFAAAGYEPELRWVRIAWGGEPGRAEMQSMIGEKIRAAIEATETLMAGGSPEIVIARYREHVAVNTKRLRTPPGV